MSCIYAQNGVQNSSSFIYVYAETKISGIENIHVEPVAATKNSDIHLVANTTTIFNANQVYVADNSFLYFNGFINATENNIYVAEKSFIAKKLPKKPNKDCIATPKTKSKITTSFKTFPPNTNSPFGFYNDGINYIAVSTTNQLFNKKKDLSLSYISITKNAEQFISSTTKLTNPQTNSSIEKHFFKYTFSLPPPSFLV